MIIPARNEAHTLDVLLASLASQSLAPLEVLVADDGSTDRTAALAIEAGPSVVRPGPKPPGWRGKTWPAFRAAQKAQGEAAVVYLFFALQLGRMLREVGSFSVLTAALASPLFLLWNPPGAGLVNVALAALCHAPFIIVQRHNRFGLNERLASQQHASALPARPMGVMP